MRSRPCVRVVSRGGDSHARASCVLAPDTRLCITGAKSHQRSKAGAAKPSLRLVPAVEEADDASEPGGPLVLTFLTEADRDTFSVELSQLVAHVKAKGKGKAGREGAGGASTAAEAARLAVAKATLLATSEDVKALHTSLVGGGVVTEEDFWASQAALLSESTARRGLGQQAGLANCLMGTVQGTQDGKSQKVNFVLTNKQIAQIFAERPSVRRAYLKHVAPAGRMRDEEFWNLYCKVEYFKLARKGKPIENEQDAKDAALFEEDEAEAQASKAEAAAVAAKLMPSINMAVRAADEALRPGWGLAHAGLETDAVPTNEAGKVSVTAALVRDLNRHAAVVLQGVPDALPEDRGALARAAHARDGGAHAPAATPMGSAEEDETMLDALTAPAAPPTHLLRITDPRRYFDTSGGVDAADPMAPPRHGAQQQPRGAVAWSALTAQIPHMVPPCPVLPSDLAKAALSDVAHVAGRPAQQLGFGAGGGGDVPEAAKRGLKEQVRDARELLKFYWQLVARNTSAAAAKAEKVLAALTAVYDRLEALKAGLGGPARHTASQQLQPLMAALDKALDHAKGGAGGEATALG